MFGFFNKKQPKIKTQEELSGPFSPILDVAQAFTYIKVSYDGHSLDLGMSTKTIQESTIALEELNLLSKTIQSVKKELNITLSDYRQQFNVQVANRGAMIPGGGKVGTFLRYMERSSRATQRGNYASTISSFKNTCIKPMDELMLACDKFKLTLKKEILTGIVS